MCLLCGTDWVFIYNSTYCPHSLFIVLCGSENKQTLFPYTALSDWSVFTARYGLRVLYTYIWSVFRFDV